MNIGLGNFDNCKITFVVISDHKQQKWKHFQKYIKGNIKSFSNLQPFSCKTPGRAAVYSWEMGQTLKEKCLELNT